MNIINKNILEVTEGIISHGVNCQGVMGSGIAKQIRAKYPEVYEDYKNYVDYCKDSNLTFLGTTKFSFITENHKLTVANCFTQKFYGRDGRVYIDYDAIESCYNVVFSYAKDYNLAVHSPIIGSGLGGGDRNKILGIIEKISQKYPSVPLTLYEYTV